VSRPLEPRRRDLGMDPSLLRPLGLMTVYFAHLDRELEFLIWCLLASRNLLNPIPQEEVAAVRMGIQVGQAVTASMSYGRKVELITTLVSERFGGNHPFVFEADKLSRLLHALEEKRNQITHSSWVGARSGEGVRLKIRNRGSKGVHRLFECVTRDQLTDLAGRMADAGTDVSLLRDKLYP
jgi:hypothetical protein